MASLAGRVVPEARRIAARMVAPEARQEEGQEARGGSGGVVPPGQHCSPPGSRDAAAAFGPVAAACHYRG